MVCSCINYGCVVLPQSGSVVHPKFGYELIEFGVMVGLMQINENINCIDAYSRPSKRSPRIMGLLLTNL